MSMLRRLIASEVGTVHISIAGSPDFSEWSIKLAETYGDPLQFCYHLLFLFDIFAFQYDRDFYSIDTLTMFKPQMRSVLEDTRVGIFSAYSGRLDGTRPHFQIGQRVHTDLPRSPDFIHDSRLFKTMGRYSFSSSRYHAPPWPESGRYRHAAMLALFNHLITKTVRTYSLRSRSTMRVFATIEMLQHHYDDAGAFGTFGSMKPSSIGKFPRYAIENARRVPDSDLDKIGNDLVTNGLYTDV